MEDYTISSKINSDEGVIDITINGQLVVSNAEKLKKELSKLRVKVPSIRFNINNVDDIDLSFLQLLEAFRQEQIEKEIDVSFEIQLNDDLKSLVDHTGLINSFIK